MCKSIRINTISRIILRFSRGLYITSLAQWLVVEQSKQGVVKSIEDNSACVERDVNSGELGIAARYYR